MKFFKGLIKYLLVVVIALSAALLAIIFLSNNAAVNQFLLRLVVLLAIGFFSGLAARVFFPKIQAIFMLLMVMAASLASILLIDLFYETPYQFDLAEANFKFTEFSISDGGQIAMMILAALPPVLILRRAIKTAAPPSQRMKNNRTPLRSQINSFLRQADPRNLQIFKPKPKPKKKAPKSRAVAKVQTKSRTTAKTKVNKPASTSPTLTVSRPSNKTKTVTKIQSGNGRKPSKAMQAPKKLKLPAKLIGSKANDVRLVGEEEHVCPYCLDEVIKGNERGTVVCPECGTWHHQDCWNLTGACGVAHRNEL